VVFTTVVLVTASSSRVIAFHAPNPLKRNPTEHLQPLT
jgi:hypothetical protein